MSLILAPFVFTGIPAMCFLFLIVKVIEYIKGGPAGCLLGSLAMVLGTGGAVVSAYINCLAWSHLYSHSEMVSTTLVYCSIIMGGFMVVLYLGLAVVLLWEMRKKPELA